MGSLLGLLGGIKNYGIWLLIATVSILWALLSMAKKDNKNLKLKQKYRDTETKLQQKILSENRTIAVNAARKKGNDRIKRAQADIKNGIVRSFGKLRRKRSNNNSTGDS